MLYQENCDKPKTGREKTLVQHAKESIEKSLRLESKLSTENFEEILSANNWRTKTILLSHNDCLKNISNSSKSWGARRSLKKLA